MYHIQRPPSFVGCERCGTTLVFWVSICNMDRVEILCNTSLGQVLVMTTCMEFRKTHDWTWTFFDACCRSLELQTLQGLQTLTRSPTFPTCSRMTPKLLHTYPKWFRIDSKLIRMWKQVDSHVIQKWLQCEVNEQRPDLHPPFPEWSEGHRQIASK